jgi:hypothetical protein
MTELICSGCGQPIEPRIKEPVEAEMPPGQPPLLFHDHDCLNVWREREAEKRQNPPRW